MTEAEIRAIARYEIACEVRAILNFWEPVTRESLNEEERDIYDNEVDAMVSKLERAAGPHRPPKRAQSGR